MGGATAPVKTHPQVCDAAALLVSRCSRMEKRAKVRPGSSTNRTHAPYTGGTMIKCNVQVLQKFCKDVSCLPQILTSVSFRMAAANTSAETPSVALSATAEKASSC